MNTRSHDDNVLCEYPQVGGEKILGRHNFQALRGGHPGETVSGGFMIRRIGGRVTLTIYG